MVRSQISQEDKEKHLKKIHYKKKFFLKSFVISLIFLLLASMFGMAMYDSCAAMCERMYGIDVGLYAAVFLAVFGLWKVLIIQFTLVPFVTLALAEKHLKEKE